MTFSETAGSCARVAGSGNTGFHFRAPSGKLASVKINLVLIFGLLFAPVWAGDPGTAALDFLGKVRDGNWNLAPGADTALQEHTTERKIEVIHRGLERLEEALRGGNLELGDVKEDEGFAAVMIRKTGGFESADMQIFPVALVKRGDDWLPAPVPASFENAVAGYTVQIKGRLAALEDWMMRKRVTDLERLVAESTERTRKQIRDSIVGEDLEGSDLGKIADRFLEACAARDRAAILGFLGGLADPLPSDWGLRLKASKAAVREDGPKDGAWRLLVSPDVVRVRVLEEGGKKSGMVSIACLDPATAGDSGTLGAILLVHLDFSRDGEGRWRIDLPEALLYDDRDKLGDDDDLDVDLLDKFPKRLRRAEPAVFGKTAADAEASVLEGLKSGGLRQLLRRVDFGSRGKEGRIACSAAADTWVSLNEVGAFRVPVGLGFREEGSLAAAAYQWFSVNDPDRFELRTLFFAKQEGGWIWSPGVVSEGGKKDHAALSDWVKGKETEWRISWRAALMQPGVKLDRIDFGKLPTDDEVKALIGDWLAALASRDLGAALSNSAWLTGDDGIPMKAIRNISYELSNTKSGEFAFSEIHRSDSWVAASIRYKSGVMFHDIFIPVVMTPAGARLLPEVDLLADDTRVRNFLNEASFGRLGKSVGEEKTAELRKLFETFRKGRK
jgi:hypothetical protein